VSAGEAVSSFVVILTHGEQVDTRLPCRKRQVSINWLAEQFGLQTPGGLRYGLCMISRRLTDDRKLRRTLRLLDAL
jgi:hypothetical protein